MAAHHATVSSPTAAGHGRLHLALDAGGSSQFSALSAAYPLKLLSPTRLPGSQPAMLSTCYILAYGGGLVAGDEISLAIKVDQGAGLLLLTQGSTKVFKLRPGMRPRSMGRGLPGINVSPTRQRLHVRQQPHTLLLLLPDPISPFRSSSYIQSQRFDLPSSSSLLVLDWYTSGRKLGKGEEWDFSRYESLNQVVVDGKTLMREKLVLDNDEDVTTGVPSLAKRMSPYHVYATLLIYGESMVPLLQMFAQHALETVQHQVSTPADMVWSFSYIRSGGKGETGRAGVVKAAAKDVEGLRGWLGEMLKHGGVEEMIGQAMWSRVF